MSQKPLLLTTKEASSILRINRAKLYALIKGDVIEGVRVGADWRVKTASIERLCGLKIPDTYFSTANPATPLACAKAQSDLPSKRSIGKLAVQMN